MTFDARPPLEGHITETVYPGWGLFRKALPYAGKLAALMGQTAFSQQFEQQENANSLYFTPQQKQAALNALYPLSGIQMNQVQRYSPYIPTQPQRLTPPPSQLGMKSIHHIQEANRRAQELHQNQTRAELEVNPASQKRVFDPYGFVPPKLAQNRADGFDPVAERKARISQQGQKAQQDYDESLQRRKHLTYIEPSESEWEQITQAFHQMPVNRYKDIRKKDEVREMLIAMKEKQPIENMANIAKPMDYLISHLNRSDLTMPILKDMFFNNLKKVMKEVFKNPEAEAKKQRIVQEVTSILGYKPLMNSDPYIIIGEQAYGLDEAVQKAKEHVAYLKKYGKPLPPLPYPTTPPNQVPQEQWRNVYPDVTEKVNTILNSIVADVSNETHKSNPGRYLRRTYKFFSTNFKNNGRHDLQVNHGLPGQIIKRDNKTGKPLTDPNDPQYCLTKDQWVIFRGKVVHAGYISNFAFGYAVAASNWYKGLTDAGSFYATVRSGEFEWPDPDIEYVHEGYEAFWKDHPELKRGAVQL